MSCKSFEMKLVLYLANELSIDERQEVETHKQTCAVCTAELERLVQLHQVLDVRPPVLPDEAAMTALRRSVSRKIRAGAGASPGLIERLAGFLQPAPALRLALGVVLLLGGFFIGKQQVTPAPGASQGDGQLLTHLLTANQPLESDHNSIQPLLGDIRKVTYNPESEQVEIHYTTINDVFLQGQSDHPAVKKLLKAAISREGDPSLRLHAVKAVHSIMEDNKLIDNDYVEALAFLVDREQNPGVRLRVLRTLNEMPDNPVVRSVLLRMMMDEQNEALRIEATNALLSGTVSVADLNILKRIARTDSNNYIRSRISEAVDLLTQDNIGQDRDKSFDDELLEAN